MVRMFPPSIPSAEEDSLTITAAVTVPPIITFPNPSSLVLILDLDAPFGSLNRTYSPILHYMALSTSTSNTTAIASYIPPKPPAGSPDHRYVILAYTLSSDSPVPFVLPKAFEKVQSGIEGRVLFDIKGFVEAVSLEELVAANWFLVGSAAGGNGTTSVPGNGTKSEPEPYTSMAVRMNSMALTGLMAVVAGMMALL